MTKVQGPINHKAVISHCYKDKTYKKALELAKKLYSKQKRKHTGVEYLSHPLTVASLLLEIGASDEALVVSALEDVLSRTTLKESTLRKEFGDSVADKVLALTPFRTPDGELNKGMYAINLVSAGTDVQNIKLASILDEVCAIPANKLAEEAEFLATCAQLTSALVGMGNPELGRRVQAAIRRARA